MIEHHAPPSLLLFFVQDCHCERNGEGEIDNTSEQSCPNGVKERRDADPQEVPKMYPHDLCPSAQFNTMCESSDLLPSVDNHSP